MAARRKSPDVQERRVPGSYRLTRVGVTGVRKPVQVIRGGRSVTLTPAISLFVDLPANQRGSHMSRNLEAVAELIDESVSRPHPSLEDLCATLSRGLLDRHAYATTAEVEMRAEYYLEMKNPSGRRTLEGYQLLARAVAHRGARHLVRKSIGVEVTGMTACPCAQETVRQLFQSGKKRAGRRTSGVPVLSHNQRNVASVLVEVPEKYPVEADDLIRLVEASQSAPTREILKRPDEARLVLEAHRNPKFVEDVVRDVLRNIVDKYRELPDEVAVTVRSEAQESIHKHNAVAERVTTLGELRRSRAGMGLDRKNCA
jgi:GTP cyclohydrolase-4